MSDGRRLLAMVIGVALGAGCVHNGFTPATTMRLSPRPEGCYLDMVFQGAPLYPYVVLGQVTTDSSAPGLWALGETSDKAIERLQAQACQVGAHGLMQAGTASVGAWSGDGSYSRSTTGAAVAFVYVDATGQVLPPPRGARLVIHPGALAPPPPAALPAATAPVNAGAPAAAQ